MHTNRMAIAHNWLRLHANQFDCFGWCNEPANVRYIFGGGTRNWSLKVKDWGHNCLNSAYAHLMNHVFNLRFLCLSSYTSSLGTSYFSNESFSMFSRMKLYGEFINDTELYRLWPSSFFQFKQRKYGFFSLL